MTGDANEDRGRYFRSCRPRRVTSRFQGLFRDRLTSTVTANAADCVSMLGNTTNELDGVTYIVGTIRNTCDHPIGSVTVIFKLEQGYGSKSPWHEGFAQAYERDVQISHAGFEELDRTL
jgi:hypothetical protein